MFRSILVHSLLQRRVGGDTSTPRFCSPSCPLSRASRPRSPPQRSVRIKANPVEHGRRQSKRFGGSGCPRRLDTRGRMTPDVETHCADDGCLRDSTIRISGPVACPSPSAVSACLSPSAAAVPRHVMTKITCRCDQHHSIAHSAPDFAYCDCRKHVPECRRSSSSRRSNGSSAAVRKLPDTSGSTAATARSALQIAQPFTR